MQILPILLTLSLLAFSTASSAPDETGSQLEATCYRACGGIGGQQEWCAAGARDELLRSLGCISESGEFMPWAIFIYQGGLHESRYRDSNCYSRFNSAPNHPTVIECDTVHSKLNSVINACFVDKNDGIGLDYLPAWPEFLYFAITTCPGQWKRSATDGAGRKRKTMSADVELRKVIDFLLNENEGDPDDEKKKKEKLLKALMKKKATVISFPYSGRGCMALAELAKIAPRLKAKYGL